MKKIVVAVMLLASSALAAPTFSVNPEPAAPDASNLVTLTFNLANDTSLFGYSLKGIPSDAAVVKERENLIAASGISDPTRVDALVIDQDLSAVPDIGFTGILFVTSYDQSGDFLNLVLEVPNVPMTINWEATFIGTFGDEYTATASTSIVPEPASMSLLALGAAFFARRRRAA